MQLPKLWVVETIREEESEDKWMDVEEAMVELLGCLVEEGQTEEECMQHWVSPCLIKEAMERVTLHATIVNHSVQDQFAMIQALANHQGESFSLLIDCWSIH